MPNRSNYCFLGIADHQGVQNVGGRIGAAQGPEAFRNQWLRLQGRHPLQKDVLDLGDIKPATTEVRQTFEKVAETLASVHSKPNRVSLVVGGGHDHGFSHILGLKRGLENNQEFLSAHNGKVKLGCINIDAHLDVRKISATDPVLSGSPFYLALESGVLLSEDFIEFGIQSHCNSRELWNYVEHKGVRVVALEELRQGKAVESFTRSLELLSKTCDAIAVSLDLDSVAQVYAPGVSAPQAEGLTSSEIIEMVEFCGTSRKVHSLGIFELNPHHDEQDRTARLAATLAYHFFDKVIYH